MTSTVVTVKVEDRGIYGIRRTVVCSCGLETIQRAMDAQGNLCGRCGYLSDPEPYTHFCCGGCGSEFPLSEGIDQTRPGLDPVPVYTCRACVEVEACDA